MVSLKTVQWEKLGSSAYGPIHYLNINYLNLNYTLFKYIYKWWKLWKPGKRKEKKNGMKCGSVWLVLGSSEAMNHILKGPVLLHQPWLKRGYQMQMCSVADIRPYRICTERLPFLQVSAQACWTGACSSWGFAEACYVPSSFLSGLVETALFCLA